MTLDHHTVPLSPPPTCHPGLRWVLTCFHTPVLLFKTNKHLIAFFFPGGSFALPPHLYKVNQLIWGGSGLSVFHKSQDPPSGAGNRQILTAQLSWA